MRYIGSKKSLLDFIYEKIKEKVGNISDKVFCDLFAGTGIVGHFFKDKVSKIISNDLEYYSYVLNRNLIQNNKKINFDFEKLNKLNEIEGFIYKNYSGFRNYFTEHNAKKIDAIRINIEKYRNDEDLYFFLLASLLKSADKVANTTSVYGAFLKKMQKAASKELIIRPFLFKESKNENEVFMQNANDLIRTIKGDILYLDPPYNSRQYGANYHLLNTIAKYKEFIPQGKTGLPKYNKSLYCKKTEIENMLEDLIKNADFKFIFLSYNNEGLIDKTNIKNMFSKYGKYQLFEKKYRRYKADNNRIYKSSFVIECLHFLQKDE